MLTISVVLTIWLIDPAFHGSMISSTMVGRYDLRRAQTNTIRYNLLTVAKWRYTISVDMFFVTSRDLHGTMDYATIQEHSWLSLLYYTLTMITTRFNGRNAASVTSLGERATRDTIRHTMLALAHQIDLMRGRSSGERFVMERILHPWNPLRDLPLLCQFDTPISRMKIFVRICTGKLPLDQNILKQANYIDYSCARDARPSALCVGHLLSSVLGTLVVTWLDRWYPSTNRKRGITNSYFKPSENV